MPVVTIEWYEGRSADQKRQIAEGVTQLLADVGGTAPDQVWIRFVDSAKADWAVGGRLQGGGASASADEALGPPD